MSSGEGGASEISLNITMNNVTDVASEMLAHCGVGFCPPSGAELEAGGMVWTNLSINNTSDTVVVDAIDPFKVNITSVN